MTKKDYVLIAKAIKKSKETNRTFASEQLIGLVGALCLVLKEDNYRFDANKFIEACGLDNN
jgi:hypothetical protein